eukprot:6180945-Pleurochrysis_carterae.AAC.2
MNRSISARRRRAARDAGANEIRPMHNCAHIPCCRCFRLSTPPHAATTSTERLSVAPDGVDVSDPPATAGRVFPDQGSIIHGRGSATQTASRWKSGTITKVSTRLSPERTPLEYANSTAGCILLLSGCSPLVAERNYCAPRLSLAELPRSLRRPVVVISSQANAK